MRILIVDDHPIYAEGLRNLLRSREYFDVEVTFSGESAVEMASIWLPDVVLMDISMPGMGGIEATRLIKARRPESKIIILTSLGDSESLIDAVRAGASGYLVKTLDGDELIDSISQLQVGKNPFSAGMEEALLMEFRRSPLQRERREIPGLGEKTKAVLGYLTEGLTYKEIGSKFCLTERAIKYHVEQAKAILGLESRIDLIDYWRAKLGKS